MRKTPEQWADFYSRVKNGYGWDQVSLTTKNFLDLMETLKHYEQALLQLACLGNGDRLGNSNGNCMAIQALRTAGLEPHSMIER